MDLDRQVGAAGIAAAALALALLPLTAPAESGFEPATSTAQAGRNLEPPPGWHVRYDGDVAATREHVVMRPGWHIHPGPAGIFWDAGNVASGNYSVKSTIFLFPAGSGEPPATVDEPYGVFFAGRDLDGPQPAYVSFLLRNDGAFRVARHEGATVTDLIAWTSHEAIATWSEGDQGQPQNILMADLREDEVVFWVNETRLGSLPRADAPSEGIVGLRAGAGSSLHVTDLVIGPNRR